MYVIAEQTTPVPADAPSLFAAWWGVGVGESGKLFITSCFPTRPSEFSGGKHPLSKMAMQEFGGRNLSLCPIRIYVAGTFRRHHR